MRHWYTFIKRSQRTTQRGGGVALHDGEIWTCVLEHRLQASQDSRSRFEKCLTGQHNVQVIVGFHFERLHNLIQHSPFLGVAADFSSEWAGWSRRPPIL